MLEIFSGAKNTNEDQNNSEYFDQVFEISPFPPYSLNRSLLQIKMLYCVVSDVYNPHKPHLFEVYEFEGNYKKTQLASITWECNDQHELELTQITAVMSDPTIIKLENGDLRKFRYRLCYTPSQLTPGHFEISTINKSATDQSKQMATHRLLNSWNSKRDGHQSQIKDSLFFELSKVCSPQYLSRISTKEVINRYSQLLTQNVSGLTSQDILNNPLMLT